MTIARKLPTQLPVKYACVRLKRIMPRHLGHTTQAHFRSIRTPSWSVCALIALMLTSFSHASTLYAQGDSLAEGKKHLDFAEFEAALASFDAALAAPDYDKATLIEIYAMRAVAFFALENIAAAEMSIAALLSIDPEQPPRASYPPQLQRVFARIKGETDGAIGVSASVENQADGVMIRTTVMRDAAAIVQKVIVYYRPAGDPQWKQIPGRSVRVPLTIDQSVEYFAQAIGPGGVILASQGADEKPLTATRTAPVEKNSGGQPVSSAPVWPWIVGGAALIAAAVAVVLVIVLTSSPSETQLSAPMRVD